LTCYLIFETWLWYSFINQYLIKIIFYCKLCSSNIVQRTLYIYIYIYIYIRVHSELIEKKQGLKRWKYVNFWRTKYNYEITCKFKKNYVHAKGINFSSDKKVVEKKQMCVTINHTWYWTYFKFN
jgi:hypothetical protein